jgi:hypothetical protein
MMSYRIDVREVRTWASSIVCAISDDQVRVDGRILQRRVRRVLGRQMFRILMVLSDSVPSFRKFLTRIDRR